MRTTCFISPIFPGITDCQAIIDEVRDACNLVWLENLNLRDDDTLRRPFDAPPAVVNFFFHEQIKKSAKASQS